MTSTLFIRSSSTAGVTLRFPGDGYSAEVFISKAAIEQAFQIAGTTEHDRQDAIGANLDEIGKIVATRLAAAPDTRTIILDPADLKEISMHVKGAAAMKAAD